MIGIIDYGAGNLHSVVNALNYLKCDYRLIKKATDFKQVKKIILPGVGAFGYAVEQLKNKKLFEKVCEWIKLDKPYLGICLGMQLLFEHSEEAKGIYGFGIFKGIIKKFTRYKVPQIGWNRVKLVKACALVEPPSKNLFYYFLHSYYAEEVEDDLIIGITEYGVCYPSIINKGNVYAVQFHPEKSGKRGLIMLKNWVERC